MPTDSEKSLDIWSVWLQIRTATNRLADDATQQEILDQAYNFVAWAAKHDIVALRTPEGRILLYTQDYYGVRVTFFNWLDDHLTERAGFWVTSSSIADLSALLARSWNKMVPFHEIFDYDGSFWGDMRK